MGKVKDNILKIALGVLGLNTFTACYGIAPTSYKDLQPFQIKGKVVDEDGNGIGGIDVSRYGTQLTVTKPDGSYEATLQRFWEPRTDTLQIHFTDVDGVAEGGRYEPTVITVDQFADASDTEVILHRAK